MAKTQTTRKLPAESYAEATPKQFGNLHERMKFLIKVAQEHEPEVPTDVWHAIWDLRIEVEGHSPIEPPLGRRPVRVGRSR